MFDLVLFYLGGFLAHCLIGEEGLSCVMENIREIGSTELRRKWAELAFLCCKNDNQLKARTARQLEEAGVTKLSH